jgi:hypothetical protein
MRTNQPSSVRAGVWAASITERFPGSAAEGVMMIALYIVTGSLCWLLRAPCWVAVCLVFGVPLVYLYATSGTTREAIDLKFVAKVVTFIVVFYDHIGIRYNAFGGASSILWLPGSVPIEHVLWCAVMVPLAIAVNQRFFTAASSAPPTRSARTIIKGIFYAGFVIALIEPLQAPFHDYTYLAIGLVLYPVIFVLALKTNRRVLRELVFTGGVFLIGNLGFELLGVRGEYWTFPGEYIGWVTIAGYRFPIEELLFTVIFGSAAMVALNMLRMNWKGRVVVGERTRRASRPPVGARLASPEALT